MWFTSDNSGPAHPALLDAITRANEGYCSSYGADDLTARVTARIRDIFEAPKAEVLLVATGTAANVVSLGALCPPWGAVFCHQHAHIEEDECGAPEFYTGGAKLVLVSGDHGRMDAPTLRHTISHTGRGGVHNVQRGVVSITQSTELGAVYSPAQIAALTAIARDFGLPVHMDGTRFANALSRTGGTAAEMSWKAGVDILSLGATKNGALAAEAIVLFDPDKFKGKAWELELRRKRGGHLFSKMRYVAAQMDAWLDDGRWLELAGRANANADHLAAGLRTIDGVEFLHPPEANGLFVAFPRDMHRRAVEAGAHYYMWPFDQSLEGPGDKMLSARLVCNWATTTRDMDAFVAALKG
jgi:threonine aldolase